MQNRENKQKTRNKMVGLIPNTSVTIGNEYCVNMPIKRRRLESGVKNTA